MISRSAFSLVSVALFALSTTGCLFESKSLDGCECPGPTMLRSGDYKVHGSLTTRPGSAYPGAGGSNYELSIDTATSTARLSYTKDGKRIIETWKKRSVVVE